MTITPNNNPPLPPIVRPVSEGYELEQLWSEFAGSTAAEPLVTVPTSRSIEVPEAPRIIVPAGVVAPRASIAKPASGLDFIEAYACWADVVEAPRAMHEAFAIQLIASLLNRS